MKTLLHKVASGKQFWLPKAIQPLFRLLSPLQDVLSYMQSDRETRKGILILVLKEMDRRQRTFWTWDAEEWEQTLCNDMTNHYPRLRQDLMVMSFLFAE